MRRRAMLDHRARVAAIAAGLFWSSAQGCRQDATNVENPRSSNQDAARPAVRVATIKPAAKRIQRRTRQPGQVEAFQQAPLYAKVPGYVSRFHVDIGDAVRGPQYGDSEGLVERGQLLAELSVPEMDQELLQKEAAIGQASAQADQARAAVKVSRAVVKTSHAQLEKARAAVDRSEADYKRWESEYRRVAELAAQKTVTAKLADETKNQLEAADAARRDAASQVEAALALTVESEAKVEQAEADEAAARAQRKVAESDHARSVALADYQRIEAPFDGTVSERNLDVGHFVQPATASQAKPLFVVVQTDVVRVFVNVPEADAALVDVGDPVMIRAPALDGREFSGKVARTAGVLDLATRTLRTEIDVPNPSGDLRPGLYVQAVVELETRDAALALPKTAVRKDGDQTVCFRVEAGKAVRTPIEIGFSDETTVEVLSGVKGGAAVIEKNIGSLADGQPVASEAPKTAR